MRLFKCPFSPYALCKTRAYVGKMLPSPPNSPSFYNCYLPPSWNIGAPTISFHRWENKAWRRIELSKLIQQFNGKSRIRIQEPWVPPLWQCTWPLLFKTHAENTNSTQLKWNTLFATWTKHWKWKLPYAMPFPGLPFCPLWGKKSQE